MSWKCECGVLNRHPVTECWSCKARPSPIDPFDEWDAFSFTPIATVVLENGRIVEVKRMLITMTYENLLLGSPETLSYHLRTRPGGLVYKGEFQPHEPTVIVDDGKGKDPLPNYRILAYMESDPQKDTLMDFSYLTACWFVDNVKIPLEEMVKALFQKIRWEDHAHDGEW